MKLILIIGYGVKDATSVVISIGGLMVNSKT